MLAMNQWLNSGQARLRIINARDFEALSPYKSMDSIIVTIGWDELLKEAEAWKQTTIEELSKPVKDAKKSATKTSSTTAHPHGLDPDSPPPWAYDYSSGVPELWERWKKIFEHPDLPQEAITQWIGEMKESYEPKDIPL